MDIDDILASLDHDTTAVESLRSDADNYNGSSTLLYSDLTYNDSQTKDKQNPNTISNSTATTSATITTSAQDYNNLIELWRNERCSPELLPYPTKLLDRILPRLQQQMEYIESLSMGFISEYSQSSKLPLLCMEAELERLKFVIRSFLRCRLKKIDKYNFYLQSIIASSDTDSANLLSKQESIYLNKHSQILLKLFNNSILKHMPVDLQAIQDTEGSISMVDEPKWDQFVFIYVKDLSTQSFMVTIPQLNEEVELSPGSIYVMRYSVIRDLLMQGKIQLI
ncbi:hypothetical protein TBLA_0B08230 [Henningerozyma blattae CBS 6284]|uniref:DNA replication complex GINS protein SLD5 n=1 Tax=Henningerozyma blattae (strain ATCC 34711 / CBS 6284 / DSM 70876 / NBRC 10599 / NRRL Y-10934 / UCD 77-7) TaxID=1071380 RepID=I2GZT6_HENB6|nr:hypothetical protein TBLA_0B08230 [Tetrapisispora blattae CBS 6284]CCH59638.1 hypothetical protein TBLA_0B08230 [Tetrapisispora blattae CBS 6284]